MQMLRCPPRTHPPALWSVTPRMWAVLVVTGDGDTGEITESNIQGPRCPPHHCPAPASAEVCGDDGNMEVEEMETSQQQHLILVIQVCEGFTV